MTQRVHFLVPGPIDQVTGGFLYDAHMLSGLRASGADVVLHELPGSFPGPDPVGRKGLQAALSRADDGDTVVIDGLAGGAHPDRLCDVAARVCLIALIHHPLHLETGLAPERARELAELEARGLRCARGIITSSPHTTRALRQWMGQGMGQWMGPNLDIETCIPGTARTAVPATADRPGPPRLLCLGTRIPRKGQDLLLRALAQLKDLDWTAVIAGSPDRDPAYSAQLDALIASLDLASRVELYGECPGAELETLFREASLFVLPSWYEGYGMAFTEAMAQGLPVVATTGGAIPDTVPETAGWLVPPGDVPALAATLREVLTHPEARLEKGRAALEHATGLPDWPQAAQRFADAVGRLCRHERSG